MSCAPYVAVADYARPNTTPWTQPEQPSMALVNTETPSAANIGAFENHSDVQLAQGAQSALIAW